MRALITGASSGIGREMAIILAKENIDVILVARDEEKLKEVQEQIGEKAEIYVADVSDSSQCKNLYNNIRDIDILINNAGFGVFGEFSETNLDLEINMINTNVSGVHILTKLYLQDMRKKNSGYILNVSSIAGFVPGPLMAAYYSSKAYVLRLTEAIYRELKNEKSNVKICALCPGPTRTHFMEKANVKFMMKTATARSVAEYGIREMFKGKLVIVPGFLNKCARVVGKIFPNKFITIFTYKIQKRRK